MAGISDNHQRLCFAVSLWNGEDSILKERMFGVTGHQGNHGEDVKELYYYLDSTPTHSYMKFLYKYPQKRYPYEELVRENMNRGRDVPEFEILDTDVFDDDRYWDVFVEVSFSTRFAAHICTKAIAYSTRKTNSPLKMFTSVSPRTTVALTRPHSTSCHSYGSRTPGHGTTIIPQSRLCTRLERA